jgi:predicted anti-sigma-YlaC factor YlaD
VLFVMCAAGCGHIAANAVADVVSGPGKTYARDDDPELVRDALPVIMKTMEQLRDSVPKHTGLLTALTRTCTSYGVAFIKEDADREQEVDVSQAKPMYARAKRMLLRARGYGLDDLELEVPGAREALFARPEARDAWLRRTGKAQVPALYWTAAAWGSAIASAKEDMALVGSLPTVGAMMQRALELDETFDDGAIHEFFIVYDMARGEAQGGGPARARAHFERARALGANKKLSPLVTYAESVTVDAQDKREFTRLLEEVLAFDVDRAPDYRLANVLAQRRAKWLLSRTSDLFAD